MPIRNNEIEIDYKNRITRVFQFIDENLEKDLSLNRLSEIAYFSPYHFHRIFKFITSENLNEYVIRKRIEKSAIDLLHSNLSITEIAYKFGFNSNSSFTKSFKKFYNVNPTEFRKLNPHKFSKIRQLKSKNGQFYPTLEEYFCIINNLKKFIKMNAKIEIKQMPKLNLAFISCVGVKNLESTYQKLIRWAIPNGLMNSETKMVTIYHDSFKITESDKVRMSASIILNKDINTKGEIDIKSIEEGKFIIGSFEIQMNEFEKSWTSLYLWMSENGYTKDDRNPFEIYNNNPNEHPEKKAIVDLYIPIK